MRLFKINSLRFRTIATITMWAMVIQVILPLLNIGSVSYGQTGPSQAESSGFSLNSTNGMVDKFTGDFSYSIPLMNVEGYPIVLQYNQNVGMETEASWVGLGWDLNVGSVSREMRGIPDDFNGEDIIRRQTKKKDYITNGAKIGVSRSWNPSIGYGIDAGISATVLGGVYKNSYNGVGSTFDFSLGGSLSKGETFNFGLLGGLGFSSDSQNGIGRSTSLGVNSSWQGKSANVGYNLGITNNFNSRKGQISLSFGGPLSAGGNRKRVSASFSAGNIGSTINFNSVTSIPRNDVEMQSTSLSTQLDLEKYRDEFLVKRSLSLIGQYYLFKTKQKDNNDYWINQSAYGYLNFGKKPLLKKSDFLMDYNYSSSTQFSEEIENLPFSAPTFDVFNYSSAGVSGTFRAQRSDVGTLTDSYVESKTKGKDVGVKVGKGTTGFGFPSFRIGATYGSGNGNEESGEWNASGQNHFTFKDEESNDVVFYKTIGEMTPRGSNLLAAYNGQAPLRRDISRSNNEISMGSNLENSNFTSQVDLTNTDGYYEASKVVTATNYELKTSEESSSSITIASENSGSEPIFLNEPRTNSFRLPHHISEVLVSDMSGMQYEYSIPAYNLTYEEVTFSMGGQTNYDDFDGLIEYVRTDLSDPSNPIYGDNSIMNNKGKAGYFDKTITPSYAHSFLLSEIKSSDYVDINNDGLSPDDIGSYYKFHHSRVYGFDDPFTWRLPISGVDNGQDPKANLNKGFKATDIDDLGNYIYGEKELWYTQSIESKNMIAVFTLDYRFDGHGANRDGFLKTDKTTKRLKKIELYHKNDLTKPIKTVELIHDYSLCQNFDRNINSYPGGNSTESGKLTLKEIRIKTGDSEERILHPYRFEYSEENANYSRIEKDRWGNFKENSLTKPNVDYPYANQDANEANSGAKNWKLTKIITPSGGLTEIEYEADSYGFVQNKRSMQHYNISGMTSLLNLASIVNQDFQNSNPNLSQNMRAKDDELDGFNANILKDFMKKFEFGKALSSKEKRNRRMPNNVVVFELPEAYYGDKSIAEQKLIDDYFTDSNPNINEADRVLEEIYFRTRVQVNPDEIVKEDVPTFARIENESTKIKGYNAFFESTTNFDQISNIGLIGVPNSNYRFGYVVLENAIINNGESDGEDENEDGNYQVNPIQLASLQFARLNLPDLVYADCTFDETTDEFDCAYKSNIDWRVAFSGDVNKILNRKEFCLKFDLNHTSLRLYDGRGRKYASSARVKSITYSDNWNEISTEYDSRYKWNYNYSDRSNEIEGVASYEPQVGKDENPFYQWSRYSNIVKSFPDESKFTEEPFADLLFPAAVIGYPKVSVSFSVDDPNGIANKTGSSQAEFYTSFDFPTDIRRTTIHREVIKTKFNLLNAKRIVGLSQGYSVITNDFHGRPKSMRVNDALGSLQSETIYNYKGLGQNCKTLNRNAEISEEQLATEFDIYSDSRFILTTSKSLQVGAELTVTPPVTIPPLFYPGDIDLKPSFNGAVSSTGFYVNTFNKIINHSAIVESIETHYLGSSNTAQNLLYDRYSGQVICSSLNDEYGDELYSYSFPAHWKYDNFRNVQREFSEASNVSLVSGVLDGGSVPIETVLSDGDIISLTDANGTTEATVLEVKVQQVYLIDIFGNPIDLPDGNYDVKVLETGRKNLLGVAMQSVTTKNGDFLNPGINAPIIPTEEIISCSALNFRENNNIKCGTYSTIPTQDESIGAEFNGNVLALDIEAGDQINPYLFGVKGSYRIANSFALQTERDVTAPHKIRYAGTIQNYIPFYQKDVSGGWIAINEPGHTAYTASDSFGEYRQLGDTKEFDEFGKPLESVDQIGVHSSVVYGYNSDLKLVPVAQAVNAKQSQIAFDGFEDYEYFTALGSDSRHFDFRDSQNSNSKVVQTERHSGLSSMRVVSGDVIGVVKEIDPTEQQPNPNIINGEYIVQDCDCVEDFSPESGDYLVGAWVKDNSETFPTTYTSPAIRISFTSGGATTVLPDIMASGKIIDGWQRLEGEFTIPDDVNLESIKVELVNTGSADVFFDDIRIHPFLAGMTTTVYNPDNLLPLATHDGYNYTTFYNYDENLELVRTRVETIEGIKTVSEQESGSVKVFKD